MNSIPASGNQPVKQQAVEARQAVGIEMSPNLIDTFLSHSAADAFQTCVLQFSQARRHLKNRDIPLEISATAYLIAGSTVLQEINAWNIYNAPVQRYLQSYLNRLDRLSVYHSQWWTHCYINYQGNLSTDEPNIHALLYPVERLYHLVNNLN